MRAATIPILGYFELRYFHLSIYTAFFPFILSLLPLHLSYLASPPKSFCTGRTHFLGLQYSLHHVQIGVSLRQRRLAFRLLPSNHRLLPPNHRLLPSNHRLLPPNHKMRRRRNTPTATIEGKAAVCAMQNEQQTVFHQFADSFDT